MRRRSGSARWRCLGSEAGWNWDPQLTCDSTPGIPDVKLAVGSKIEGCSYAALHRGSTGNDLVRRAFVVVEILRSALLLGAKGADGDDQKPEW